MNLAELKGKEIKIFLKNGFYHQGELLDFDKNCVKIQDRFKGIMVLNFSIIKSIEENGRR